MAMVCCRVCKSTPIIFISASFVPSNLWLEHQHFTRLVVRPTSLCHQTERFLIFVWMRFVLLVTVGDFSEKGKLPVCPVPPRSAKTAVNFMPLDYHTCLLRAGAP